MIKKCLCLSRYTSLAQCVCQMLLILRAAIGVVFKHELNDRLLGLPYASRAPQKPCHRPFAPLPRFVQTTELRQHRGAEES